MSEPTEADVRAMALKFADAIAEDWLRLRARVAELEACIRAKDELIAFLRRHVDGDEAPAPLLKETT
jgi:hypothetical protein